VIVWKVIYATAGIQSYFYQFKTNRPIILCRINHMFSNISFKMQLTSADVAPAEGDRERTHIILLAIFS